MPTNPPPLPGNFPPVTRTWYVLIAGQQSGPYPEEQLRDWVMRGQVAGDALICSEGMTEWVKAGEFFSRTAIPGGRFSPQPLEFVAGVGALFGRTLLLIFGILLVIPAPWAITYFYQWFIAHLRLPRVSRLEFTGVPGDKWLLCIVLALGGYIGALKNPAFQIVPLFLQPYLSLLLIRWVVGKLTADGRPLPLRFTGAPGDQWILCIVLALGGYIGTLKNPAFQLIPLFLQPYLSLLLIRWVVGKLTADGRPLPLRFTGGYWRFFGWYLLIALSMFTIVGWAWVVAANMRWVCRKVEGTNTQVTFTGTGLEILWRTLVFVFSAIVILPIPWTFHWYTRWFIRQFSLEGRS